MKIKLVADSSANLFRMEDIDFSAASMRICAGENEYVDTENLDVTEMLQGLASYDGKSSSACPGIGEWTEAFGDADIVYGVSLTSNLSGCYHAACAAARQYEADHPGKRVFLLDSLSTGPEMELILEKYKEYVKTGLSFDEVVSSIREYCKHTHLWFSLESLETFAKNGRVKPAIAKFAGLLGIRIVGRASDLGTLEPRYKCRGERSAIRQIFTCMKEAGYSGGKVRLSHTFNLEAAASLKAMILNEFPNADVRIRENHGLCSYYAEKGGVLAGFEA